MSSSLSLRALALALFAVPLLSFAQTRPGVEVVVQGEASVEKLAEMLGGNGRVVARENLAGAYRIRLSPGYGVDFARRKFGPDRPFQFVRFAGYTETRSNLDPESISSIETYSKKFEWVKTTHPNAPKTPLAKGKPRKQRPDALQAKLYRLRQFAFPFDKIDPSSQIRAAAQLETLRKAGGRVLNGPPAPSQKWAFTGPKNLDIPYVVYYGTPPLSGRVNAVAYDPIDPKIMYAGAALGGVMKSVDNGVNWTPLSDNASWPFLAVNSITINPSNGQEIFVGVGDYPGGLNYGSGIMHSRDGGSTWRRLSEANGLPALNGITKIGIVTPGTGQTGNVLIATAGGGAEGGGGIYRSADNG
ncbi:exo-alpha-sialidase, partial [bacterium]